KAVLVVLAPLTRADRRWVPEGIEVEGDTLAVAHALADTMRFAKPSQPIEPGALLHRGLANGLETQPVAIEGNGDGEIADADRSVEEFGGHRILSCRNKRSGRGDSAVP